MEELVALAIIMREGWIAESEFSNRLDEMLLDCSEEDSDYDMLLEMECADDNRQMMQVLYNHMNENIKDFDKEKFGRTLMNRLKPIYHQNTNIRIFGERMYSLWEGLIPVYLQDEEPFHILSYADEPLSWGDEEQTRLLYEKMLNYYE